MQKAFIACGIALALTACGGGGGDVNSSAKPTAISFYGNPIGGSSSAVSHAAVIHAASDSAASSPSTTTGVMTLTEALAAQGVTATITPQVLNGTTLHQLIMGQDNGLPPTQDQFKTDPNAYQVVNFALDDMVTPDSDATQAAAVAQFKTDLETFVQRAHVAGKLVLVVLPIPTCDAVPNYATQGGHNAAFALTLAISQAAVDTGAFPVGGLTSNIVTSDGTVQNDFTAGHLGADCRTPDNYLLNAQVQAVAADIAPRLTAGLGS
jgi:hypothetical protein